MFSHQFARHCDNLEIKRCLAMNRFIDAQQQKVVNGLNPGSFVAQMGQKAESMVARVANWLQD